MIGFSVANVKSSLKPEFQNKTLLTAYKNPLSNSHLTKCSNFVQVIMSLIFLIQALMSNTLASTCRQTTAQKLYLKVCVKGQGAAPVTGLSAGSRCPGSNVCLLHRSTQLSLQAGCLWCAGRDVWPSYSIKQWVSGLLFWPRLNECL